MGKKGKWFGAVKKVFSPESKEKKEEVMLARPLGILLRFAGFVLDLWVDLIGFSWFPFSQFRRIQSGVPG